MAYIMPTMAYIMSLNEQWQYTLAILFIYMSDFACTCRVIKHKNSKLTQKSGKKGANKRVQNLIEIFLYRIPCFSF